MLGPPHLREGRWWEDARLHCAHAGLRLCSVAEISRGAGRSAGCNFDEYLIWTSDPCYDLGEAAPAKEDVIKRQLTPNHIKW